MAAPNPQARRIQRDIEELNRNPLSFIENLQSIPLDESAKIDGCTHQITGVLLGPTGSDYAGERFNFLLRFPAEYPFRPPELLFSTPNLIVHPNVDAATGLVCHDQLIATWTAKVSLSELLTKFHNLLAHPNYEKPIERAHNNSQQNPENA